MRLPAVRNLRKVAKQTHFVATNGEVVPYPVGYGWGANARINRSRALAVSKIAGMDDENKDADKELLQFLSKMGRNRIDGNAGQR